MEYTYTTTAAMDTALEAEAKKQNTTAEALFNIIVTADMGTLTRNYEAVKKEQVYAAYKADPAVAAPIDAAIAASVKPEPIDIKPSPVEMTPAEPVVGVTP